MDWLPASMAHVCPAPFQPERAQAETPVCSLEPHTIYRASALLSCSDTLEPELGGFPGLLTYRLFQLPFCWGYQFSGFLGWLCFNLSPWSRLRRLPLSLGQEEMEGPGSLGQALEPADFQEQMLGSQGGSSAPPTCLPPNRPVNY